MIKVDMHELRNDLGKYLQRIRDEGDTIEITMHGEAVAQMIPMQRKSRSPEELAEIFKNLEELAQEISEHWIDDLDAVDAVREQRREL